MLCFVSLLFWRGSICRKLCVIMQEFVEDLAYVINAGAHLPTNKQSKQLPMYRQCRSASKSSSAHVLDIMTSAAEHRLWTCVLVCVILKCMTRPNSDVGSGMIISVLGHMLIIPSLGNITTQRSSHTLSSELFIFQGMYILLSHHHHRMQKCLQMCKHLFHLILMLRNF